MGSATLVRIHARAGAARCWELSPRLQPAARRLHSALALPLSANPRPCSLDPQRHQTRLQNTAPSRKIASQASGAHMALPTPVVEPEWLAQNLGSVKVLDASWYMPAEKRSPLAEFQAGRIPGALFFDIESIADVSVPLPHMLPSEAAFAAAASALGLRNSDSIVVYDGKGIFAAARAWWTFRAFGHESVAVLDGGLPAWKAEGLPLETEPSTDAEARAKAAADAVRAAYSQTIIPKDLPYQARLKPDLVLSLEQVRQNIDSKSYQVIDARAAGRFLGTDPEPRPGLPSGSIPGSFNLPFPKVLGSNGGLLCPVELEAAFKDAGVDLTKPVATSCGTGVTASILALALFRIGQTGVPVYDGSWTEWASTTGVPISKQANV